MRPIKIIDKLNESESNTIDDLKNKLEDLADRNFYPEMKSGWTRDDFRRSDEISAEIAKTIAALDELGIIAIYKLGHDIEYRNKKV